MKIEQFIIHPVAFEPILIVFRVLFCRSTFCNVAHSPWSALRSDFGFFSFAFRIDFFAISFTNFIMMTVFLLVFSSFRPCTQSHAVFTEVKIESHFSYRFIFGDRYIYSCCCRRCRCSDYVTLSNCFRLHAVNLKMSVNLNDRVEEFILKFSLHFGIQELAAPFLLSGYFSCILAMC